MTVREVYIGKSPDFRAYLRVSLGSVETATTVDHEDVENVTTLSLTGQTIDPYDRDVSAGQIINELAEITEPSGAFEDWRLDSLIETWRKYHLNQLQAGCAHQKVVWERNERFGYNQPSLTRTEPCPKTGYRYGTGWLLREIPTDVEEAIRAFINGDSPRWEVQH